MDESKRAMARVEEGENEIIHLGDCELDVRGRAILKRLAELRPRAIERLQGDIEYFSREGIEYQTEVPALVDFLDKYNDFSASIDVADSLEKMNMLMGELREISKKILKGLRDESREHGCFESKIYGLIEDEINKLDKKREKADIQNYKERFHSRLPEKIFDLFVDREGRDLGLKESIQGTMAASEVLSGESYRNLLNGELNLAYPGCGSHLTPLIMAFDLIERGSIEGANFILNDKDDMNPVVDNVLKYLMTQEAIEGLEVGFSNKDPDQRMYSFLYHNKPVRVYCSVEDSYDVTDWNPGGAPLNVVYDHLPFQSAFAGAVSTFLSESDEIVGDHKIAYINAGDRTPDSVIRSGKILRSDVVKNVSFADKGNWTVEGDKGVGLTVVVVDHKR